MSRILLYAQHLSGVGHHVRIDLLARGLARRHQVWLVDGGAPVPRAPVPDSVHRLRIPRLRREDGAVVPVSASESLAAVLAERARLLDAAIASVRPDAVVIEHFPFSKWELAAEIIALLDAARAVHPGVRVVCSIRDIVWKTRFDPDDERTHTERTLRTLNERFDAVLVHSDPRVTRLEETFPRAGEIRPPVNYTGVVSEKIQYARPVPPATGSGALVVASSGGGTEGFDLARNVVRAVRLLTAEMPNLRLALFTGLFFPERHVDALRTEATGLPVSIEPFAADFLATLAASAVSVSRAGYNTCANLLETGVRAVLVPSAARSDQRLRARKLAALGAAEVLDEHVPAPETIVTALRAALSRRVGRCDVDLDGVERSSTLIDELLRRGASASRVALGPTVIAARP